MLYRFKSSQEQKFKKLMRKFLALFRAGLMGWGESRGEPGGRGEAGVRGRGEGEREAAATAVGEARGEQPGVDSGDSSAMS
jgi:hypothetical protein